MRLSRKGTLSFKVNSSVSQDYEVQAVVGQCDPNSSFAFNLAAAPLNHFLATSPSVPRFKIEDEEAAPIFSVGDDFMLLNGREECTEFIIQLMQKISQYQPVSGLTLNVSMC